MGTAIGFQPHFTIGAGTSPGLPLSRSVAFGRSMGWSLDGQALAIGDQDLVWVYTSNDVTGSSRLGPTWLANPRQLNVSRLEAPRQASSAAVHASTVADYVYGSDMAIVWSDTCLYVGTPLSGTPPSACL